MDGIRPGGADVSASGPADSLHDQVETLLQRGNLEEAERLLRHQIASGGTDASRLCRLAALCGRKGHFAELKQLAHQAISLQPDCAEAYNYLGNALQAEGNLEAALTSFQQALAFCPAYVSAWINLGSLWREMGRPDAAIDCLNSALRLEPDSPEAFSNLGVALQEKGELEAAIEAYQAALRRSPEFAAAHFNLGNALRDKREFSAASQCYGQALRLQPSFPEAAYNLSMMLMLLADYQRGWLCYEQRFHLNKGRILPLVTPGIPLWDGRPLERGDRLLIVAEQGLGDCLQFMRYALPLVRQGVEVSLCPPPVLRDLLAASALAPQLLSPEQAEAVTDGCWIPLLSLPRHLAVAPDNPLITEPYLRTTDAHLQHWGQVLAGQRRPIIALNWQGNPQSETTTLRGRSLPLESFAALAARSQASLLSLQKGAGCEQLASCSFRHRFASCQHQVSAAWDFLDTAAILSHCDLVISSDTAVAHLAAALGRETWLLLHDAPDWRWGLETETSFWYPHLRLFRQRQAGDWAEPIERVVQEVEALESLMALMGMPGEA